MTRTFSKIHGLGGLRLGWMFAPAHVVDAINRMRGPFNVNAVAIEAGIAALRDRAHVERTAIHNDELAALADRGVHRAWAEGHAERRQFRAGAFPRRRQSTRPLRPTTGCRARGYILRRVAGYGFPNALRMTVGTEEANRGVVAALDRIPEKLSAMPQPMFEKIALVGIGLIGSSLARVIAPRRSGRPYRHRHAQRRDAGAGAGARPRRQLFARMRRRRCGTPTWSSSRCRSARRGRSRKKSRRR